MRKAYVLCVWMIHTTPHCHPREREIRWGPQGCGMSLEEVQVLGGRHHLRGECIPRAPGLFECASLIRSFTQTRPFGNVCDVAPGDAGCWTGIVSFFSENGFVTLRRLWPGSLSWILMHCAAPLPRSPMVLDPDSALEGVCGADAGLFWNHGFGAGLVSQRAPHPC